MRQKLFIYRRQNGKRNDSGSEIGEGSLTAWQLTKKRSENINSKLYIKYEI